MSADHDLSITIHKLTDPHLPIKPAFRKVKKFQVIFQHLSIKYKQITENEIPIPTLNLQMLETDNDDLIEHVLSEMRTHTIIFHAELKIN